MEVKIISTGSVCPECNGDGQTYGVMGFSTCKLCNGKGMAGGYDLYGTYYPNINDAINAKMSQCNEIDNRFLQKKINELERKLHEQQRPSNEEEIYHLWGKIQDLEERIAVLEGRS